MFKAWQDIGRKLKLYDLACLWACDFIVMLIGFIVLGHWVFFWLGLIFLLLYWIEIWFQLRYKRMIEHNECLTMYQVIARD